MTSEKSIIDAYPPSSEGNSRVLRSINGVDPVEQAAAALEQQLEQVKTERKQERFFWILACAALLNTLIAALAPAAASVVLLLFSLVLLIGAAKHFEVPWVVRHLERWFDRASLTKGGKEPE